MAESILRKHVMPSEYVTIASGDSYTFSGATSGVYLIYVNTRLGSPGLYLVMAHAQTVSNIVSSQYATVTSTSGTNGQIEIANSASADMFAFIFLMS